MEKKLPVGKLNFDLLERLLKKYTNILDPRVVIGPKLGEDAAIIDYSDCYLVAKTDPITFATDEIGWYAVQVNANDIAIRGANPKWFQAAILLPQNKTTKKLVEEIFNQISKACTKLNISLVGGHTEVSYNLDRPIVVGCMLGEVKKEKLVLTSGAKPGDDIILTKGIVIEGTSIIARERENELKERGFSSNFIKKCKKFLFSPGISVVKDALLANNFDIHCMHDPTEGGLVGGLYEISIASGVGFLIREKDIPILEETKILFKKYNLDPLRTITSGSLLIAASNENSKKIISLLESNNIKAAVIGEIKDKNFGIKILTDSGLENLKYTGKDEIVKLFKN